MEENKSALNSESKLITESQITSESKLTSAPQETSECQSNGEPQSRGEGKVPELNAHNKEEYPPMHTAEHLLNGEIARRYKCGRAFSAHIERKKSKLDYHMPTQLTDAELRSLEDYINGIVKEDVEVTEEYISQEEAKKRFDMSRLPDGASETVRVVKVGPYDECLCAGTHVKRTSEIGTFRITSTRYQDGIQRIVFKLN